MMGQAITVWQKDVLVEWKTRARLNALFFFALATLLMFSFALGADTKTLRAHAGGYYWLGLFFASVMALQESFRIEKENRALEHLLLVPINPRAIFLGKAASNLSLLLVLGVIITPIMIALYDVQTSWIGVGKLLGVLLLGAAALSATGTLLSAIAVNAKAQDVLLPLLLFPLMVPTLLCSVKASQLALDGDPMHDMASWTGMLAAFNLVYWSLGFVLFPAVVEE